MHDLVKAGTGIKRVQDACKKNNNAVEFEFSDAFWVTIKSNGTDKVTDNQQKIIIKVKDKSCPPWKGEAYKVGRGMKKEEKNI